MEIEYFICTCSAVTSVCCFTSSTTPRTTAPASYSRSRASRCSAAPTMSSGPPNKKRKTKNALKGVGAMLIRPQQAARTGATARMVVNPSADAGRQKGAGITRELMPAPVAVQWAPPWTQVLPATADFEDAGPLDDLAFALGDADSGQLGDCGVTVVCRGRRVEENHEGDGGGGAAHPVSHAVTYVVRTLTCRPGGPSCRLSCRQRGVRRRAHDAGRARGVCVRGMPGMPAL